jgi:DNA/RNA endonuclease YhcR with UshA esterase domain
MTLTCTNGKYTITVSTNVLIKDGQVVTESYFKGKTIDVKGLVATFDGSYQIKLLSLDSVVVK